MQLKRPPVLSRNTASVSFITIVAALLWSVVPAWPQELPSSDPLKVFARIDEMIADVEKVMGLKALTPIPRSLLTREEINELVSSRMEEEDSTEGLVNEELFLQLFGFTAKKFDLAQGIVNTLTEQATALYDYRTKQLYLSTWTPEDMQEFALVHEIAHAIADQHFDLGNYVGKSKSADSDLARSAVIEGQASWVMTEWVMQQSGHSLRDNSQLAAAAAGASRYEATEYPIFASQPLYLREAMLFPYAQGMIFQQRVIERFGDGGFQEVFRVPPLSTQHILDSNAYFTKRLPSRIKLPSVKLKGFKRVSRGDVGQFDHSVLLRQHDNEADAERISRLWRGGRYEVWTNSQSGHAVLRYASDWEDAVAAKAYFDAYRRILESKWEHMEVDGRSRNRIEGIGDNGRFIVTLEGTLVTSIEGLPNTTPASDTAQTEQ